MLNHTLLICLLGLLFIRPFICSVAFTQNDLILHACMAFVCLARLWLKPQKRPILKQPVCVWALIFLACVMVSCLSSINIYRSLLALPGYIAAVLCFLTVYTLEEKEIRWLIPVLILSAVCVSLQAMFWLWHGSLNILEFFKAQNFYYDFANELISRDRAFIPFILPSALGGFLILVLPVSIAYYIENYKNIDVPLFKRPLANSLFMVPVVLLLAALFLARSLGPVLSILLGSLIVLGSRKPGKNRALAFLFWLMTGCAVMLICIRSYSVGYWRNPIFSLGQRQLYWQNTLKVIKLFPLSGVGPGNMPFVGSWFSHNSYLQLWAETGIFGLLSFLIFISAGFADWLKSGAANKVFALGLGIAVLSFLIHNLADFTFFLPEVSVFWWVMLALFCRKRYTYNGTR